MKTIIIPTSDIIREYRTYDHMFGFLDNGVRDVLVEAAIASSSKRREAAARRFKQQEDSMFFYGGPKSALAYSSELTQSMINRYFDTFTEGRGSQSFFNHEHSTNVGVIESVVGEIEETIFYLLSSYIRMDGSQFSPNMRKPWVGNDMIVNIFNRDHGY